MRRFAGRDQNAIRFAHQWTESSGQKPHNRISHRLIAFAAAGFVCAVLSGIAMPGKAVAADVSGERLAALRGYAQQINVPVARADDQTVAALRAFAQRVGTDQPQSTKTLTKVAAVDRAATFVGSAKCATCHSALISEFKKTLMGKIGVARKGTMECENCHGPGSEHVRLGGGRGVGGILSFGKDDPRSVEERNGICLGCHQKGERTYWAGSVHETRGVACTNCHTVMKNVSRKHNLKKRVEAEVCYQCHKLKRAQMQFSSHMPVREGKITCTNCHNPHGSITEKLIRAASVNQLCYNCHAEKRGPFLYEHAPVRESCLNCHKPHGSNYENLLKVARPRLRQLPQQHTRLESSERHVLPPVRTGSLSEIRLSHAEYRDLTSWGHDNEDAGWFPSNMRGRRVGNRHRLRFADAGCRRDADQGAANRGTDVVVRRFR